MVKRNPITAIALLGKGTETVTSNVVDMKVTKADLFDLIINEARGELQVEVSAAQQRLIEAGKKRDDAARVLGQKAAKSTVDAINTMLKIQPLKNMASNVTPKVEVNVHSAYHGEAKVVKITYTVTLGTGYYDDNTLYIRARDVEVPTNAEVRKLDKQWRAANEEAGQLRAELDQLRSQTKTMKSQVVRNILNSSNEGQNILAGLDAMKKTFRQQRKLLEKA